MGPSCCHLHSLRISCYLSPFKMRTSLSRRRMMQSSGAHCTYTSLRCRLQTKKMSIIYQDFASLQCPDYRLHIWYRPLRWRCRHEAHWTRWCCSLGIIFVDSLLRVQLTPQFTYEIRSLARKLFLRFAVVTNPYCPSTLVALFIRYYPRNARKTSELLCLPCTLLISKSHVGISAGDIALHASSNWAIYRRVLHCPQSRFALMRSEDQE